MSDSDTTSQEADDSGMNQNDNISGQGRDQVPIILDGKFFKIVEQTGNIVKAKCMLCFGFYKGRMSSTSNFLKHIQLMHHTSMDAFKKHKDDTFLHPTKKQKLDVEPSTSRKLTDVCLKTPFTVSKRKSCLQKSADESITKFVIESGSPLRLVELPSFKKMIEIVSSGGVVCLGRKKLNKNIEVQHKEMMEMVIEAVKQTQFVGTTADLWTSHGRSFLGVTLHYINDQFERVSYALACQRFTSLHTFNNIAITLTKIFENYEISLSKIVTCVTDNGSNFVKAFTQYGLKTAEIPTSDENVDTDGGLELLEDGETSDFDFEFEQIHFSSTEEESEITLPFRLSCASHSLSLIATTDLNKTIKNNKPLSTMFKQSLTKCAGLWNKIGRSHYATTLFKNKFNKLIRKPCQTRWNSLYDSFSDILLLDKKKLVEFMSHQNLPCLTESNFRFIGEYLMCLKPIAETLDKLQGERNVFIGDVIPCILNVKHKISSIPTAELTACKELPGLLLKSIEKRFGFVFNIDMGNEYSSFLTLATFSIPKWKLRLISDSTLRESVKNKAVKEILCLQQNTVQKSSETVISSEEIAKEKMFYTFVDFHSNNNEVDVNAGNCIELEIMKYLCDERLDIISLLDYPNIRRLFYKYNAGTPSSAPVERLFSFGGIIMNSKRTNLHDKKFEIITLLKANAKR